MSATRRTRQFRQPAMSCRSLLLLNPLQRYYEGCSWFGPLELKREFAQLECIAKARARCELPPGARVHSCYEAGRDRFWLHRWLIAQGIDNIVVDSASIEVNRRARRAKTDRLDGDKLLAMLIRYHAGERRVWSVVRVPTPEQEDARRAHRELGRLGR